MILLILLSQLSMGAPMPKGQSIMSDESEPRRLPSLAGEPEAVKEENRVVLTRSALEDKPNKKAQNSHAPIIQGNLPSYLSGKTIASQESGPKFIHVSSKVKLENKNIKVGDIYRGMLEQAIVASPGVPTPIRVYVTTGSVRGGFFMGEATLDKELKRVLLSFKTYRDLSGNVFNVKATGLSLSGSIGLEGEYHSDAGKFFLAELASATAAGLLDSTIQRNQNNIGNFVVEPSLGTSAKTGAVSALSRTTERMAERSRQAPEYTTLNGYSEIQIIVEEKATEG